MISKHVFQTAPISKLLNILLTTHKLLNINTIKPLQYNKQYN